MEKFLMKGNEALAEAAIAAGCRHFFGYPITPQTEIAAYMSKKMPTIGGVYLQAESEIAAINMVLGASAAGVRAMTSSSSPGISLKTEAISYIAGCELPAVIVNIQRAGPGLGGIQPSQADYYQATKAPGHGDIKILVYAPASVQEMIDVCMDSFDKADHYRMPVMILGDGMLGQMMESVTFDKKEATVIEKPWATNGHKNQRQHNIVNSLYLKPEELEKKLIERFEKFEYIKQHEQRFEEYMLDDAEYVFVAYGAAARIAKSVINDARRSGLKVGLIRPITLSPFPTIPFDKIKGDPRVKQVFCLEMSMGQMIDDVRLALECKKKVDLISRTGGMVPSPEFVSENLRRLI